MVRSVFWYVLPVVGVTDWGKVIIALISAVSTSIGTVLVYRRWVLKEKPATEIATEDARVVRQRQLAEAWGELATHYQERLKEAEYAVDECRRELRSCEADGIEAEARWSRQLLFEQAQVEHLKTEVARLRTQIKTLRA